MTSYRLAASAEMLFTDLDFIDRVRAIHDRGFEVEIWGWTNKDLPALAATGATFGSMTGYIEGDLLEQDGIARLLETAAESIEAAKIINCARLNLHGTGLDSNGQAIRKLSSVTDAQWRTAVDTLKRLAELGEKHNQVFMIENLNLEVDHPGTPFAHAHETLKLVQQVGSPFMTMNLDLYHAQIGEGNLSELVIKSQPFIGEIQVADVPGRMQPGTGEINYRFIASVLKKINYSGVVGLEGWASGDSNQALDDFAEAFA